MAISNTHNLAAMNAEKFSSVNKSAEARVIEKFNSDGKADQAEDIAASLEISERMRRQFRGTNQSVQTAQEDTSFNRVADSVLEKVSKMRHQINGLSLKAAGGASSASDRQAVQQEIHQLLREIDKIRDSAQFNRQYSFKGTDANIDGAEIVENATDNILQRATQSMLTQANQQPDFVMQLLQ